MNFPEMNKGKFNEQRRILIDSLRKRGNLDNDVLDVMANLPREIFINPAFSHRAYEDNALPISANQTISQPYTVAYMTSQLNIRNGDKILEIGTGSGYQACILYMLGARVFTVERIPELHESSKLIFKKFGFNINSRLADGTLGWRDFALYNGIIITAAAPKVPVQLISQLETGGKMVVPVGAKEYQVMHIITKLEDEKYDDEKTDSFKFVPLIGKDGWKKDEN